MHSSSLWFSFCSLIFLSSVFCAPPPPHLDLLSFPIEFISLGSCSSISEMRLRFHDRYPISFPHLHLLSPEGVIWGHLRTSEWPSPGMGAELGCCDSDLEKGQLRSPHQWVQNRRVQGQHNIAAGHFQHCADRVWTAFTPSPPRQVTLPACRL